MGQGVPLDLGPDLLPVAGMFNAQKNHAVDPVFHKSIITLKQVLGHPETLADHQLVAAFLGFTLHRRKTAEQHRRHLWLPDQDLISGLYGDQILQLDSWKWNMTERLYAMQPGRRERVGISWVRENSAIIHYCGRGKPWKGRYLGSLDVFYKEAEAAFYRSGRCLPPLEPEEH